jgi:hypothetical protein
MPTPNAGGQSRSQEYLQLPGDEILEDVIFGGDAAPDDPFEANHAQEMDAYSFQ